MRRIILGFAAIVFAVFSVPAPCQETGAADKAIIKGTSAGGLEIEVVGIENSARRNQDGQVLLPVGSCPPGVVKDFYLMSGGVVPGVVVRLSLTGAPGYAATELSGPPVVVDTDGENHEPLAPFFLPDLDVLKSLKSSGEALLCEFPFDVYAGYVRAIEFEGLRLDVAPQ